MPNNEAQAVELTVVANFNPNDDICGQDPCVVIDYPGRGALLRTTTHVDSSRPSFTERLADIVPVQGFPSFDVSVRNWRTMMPFPRLPVATVSLERVLSNEEDELTMPLDDPDPRGGTVRHAGEVRIRMRRRGAKGGVQQKKHSDAHSSKSRRTSHSGCSGSCVSGYSTGTKRKRAGAAPPTSPGARRSAGGARKRAGSAIPTGRGAGKSAGV